MKLLIDEMYAASIAAGLRARGHDARGVVERPELRGTTDADLFAAAQAERRTLITENVPDFVPIANAHDARGQAHHGLVLVHAGKHPRGNPRTIGAIVSAPDTLARRYPADEPISLREWL